MILVRPITRSSHHFPKKPAVSPSTIPIILFNNWLTNPTSNDIRAPKIIRDRISLPWLSVPNQKTRLGASSETIRSASSMGWYGAINGAKRAMKITIMVMHAPTTRLGLFFNFRMVSFTRIFPLPVFYAGIY
jgi:hypothetical protein